jgi:hypothetical protein
MRSAAHSKPPASAATEAAGRIRSVPAGRNVNSRGCQPTGPVSRAGPIPPGSRLTLWQSRSDRPTVAVGFSPRTRVPKGRASRSDACAATGCHGCHRRYATCPSRGTLRGLKPTATVGLSLRDGQKVRCPAAGLKVLGGPVPYNRRDLAEGCARFGIRVLTPKEFLHLIEPTL